MGDAKMRGHLSHCAFKVAQHASAMQVDQVLTWLVRQRGAIVVKKRREAAVLDRLVKEAPEAIERIVRQASLPPGNPFRNQGDAGVEFSLSERLEEILMRMARFNEPQILAILRQAEGGMPVAELCHEQGMSTASSDKWRGEWRDGCSDLAPGSRTRGLFDWAAIFINMSILACAGVGYPMLECRRCRF